MNKKAFMALVRQGVLGEKGAQLEVMRVIDLYPTNLVKKADLKLRLQKVFFSKNRALAEGFCAAMDVFFDELTKCDAVNKKNGN